jgi:hypothetical protein
VKVNPTTTLREPTSAAERMGATSMGATGTLEKNAESQRQTGQIDMDRMLHLLIRAQALESYFHPSSNNQQFDTN